MEDEELQKATASDRLTLEEEYAMQKSWREDADKLTFIVCTAPADTASLSKTNIQLKAGQQDSPDAMIGDINLFLYVNEEDDEEEDLSKPQSVLGEIEIMIARDTHQGKGLGRTVLQTFIWYILSSANEIVKEYHSSHGHGKPSSELRFLRVKIDAGNARSIKLFESAGFKKVSETPNYFGELEFRCLVDGSRELEGKMQEAMGAVPVVVEYP